MRRIYVLAALVAPLLADSAIAAQALAVSGSAACSRSYAVAINAANRDEAKRRALAECRDVTGKNDCQIILENNSPGYGALYAAIVSDRECYVSALTGFANRNAAHDATLADCKKYYGVSSCTPLNDWRETGASNSPSVVRAQGSAAVAKAAPVPNAQQAASLQKSQTKNERSDAGAQSSEKASAPNNAVPGSDLKPNWTNFTEVSIDGANIYVDKNTIDKGGKVVKFRVLTDNYQEQKTKSGHPFRSTVRHWEFACSSHNVRYTKYEVYSGNMGHGEKMFADPQDQFMPYEPDSATIAGALHNFACGTPGNYRHTSRDSEPDLFWYCDHRQGTVISEDAIRKAKKSEQLVVDAVSKNSGKSTKKAALDLGKGAYRLEIVAPDYFLGPYSHSKNPGAWTGLPKAPDYVGGGEVVFHGTPTHSRVAIYAGYIVTFPKGRDKEKGESLLLPERYANEMLRMYGFDLCRATRVDDPKIREDGALIATYKASGMSMYESKEDKNDRLTIFVTGVVTPDRKTAYTLAAVVVEKDINAYNANPAQLERAAYEAFLDLYANHKIFKK